MANFGSLDEELAKVEAETTEESRTNGTLATWERRNEFMNRISWERGVARPFKTNGRSETAFSLDDVAVCSVMDYPTTRIRGRTTRELGNVETTVCVLIKSNETNLRSIMRPLERYGNASCRLAPLNCERAHRCPGRARAAKRFVFARYFIEQSIENITNSRNNPTL